MKTYLLPIAVAAALVAVPAYAQNKMGDVSGNTGIISQGTVVAAHGKPALTVREALSLAAGLRNLDGHLVVVKQNGTDGTVMVPWNFGSGALRLRIANDLAIVAAVEASTEKARQGIVREILRKSGGGEAIKVGTPDYDEFQKQYDQVLDAPAPGAIDLSRIKASELKLDGNEIGVTVLQALRPILDADQ